MIVVRSRGKKDYMEALHQEDLEFGSTPSIGTHAELDKIRPFLRYFTALIAEEIYNDVRFLTEPDENVWWYDGHQAYGYAYNGSPWSGRVDMSLACPSCGAQMDTTESGWRIRSEALKASQTEDLKRGRRMQFLHPSFEPATIQELLRYLNVPEEDLVLPPEKHKITRHKLGNGRVLVHDSAGGFVIVEE